MTADVGVPPVHSFDDRLWNHLWERNLSSVERHAIAVTVWRRRHPTDHFEAVVAFELARRWRAHILTLMTAYALWTVFWGMLAARDLRLDSAFESMLTPVMTAIGVAALTVCIAIRRRLAGWLRANSVPLR